MFVENDFPMLKKSIIYFDNGATTFKPYSVINAIVDYYSNYTANAHRGDYDLSHKVDTEYENAREKVRAFINAKNSDEIIFTSGTTQSINMIVKGFFSSYLKESDEVLLTKAEHASNVLPWFELSRINGFKIRYIDLDKELQVTLDSVKKAITNNTKVISIAHATNVIGDIRPIKEIVEYAHSKGILVVVDGAQSVPHMKTDVQDLGVDFLAFSAHKMCGPTGVGVLYGKYALLDKLIPENYGGGMNTIFSSEIDTEYKKLPHRLEAGTPNIEGVIGIGAAIDYLNNIGMDKIDSYLKSLKKYAIEKLSGLDNIEIYNKNIEGTTIAFNVKNVFAQDTAVYLNKNGICVRAGNHCAKILKDELGITNTCRISFYLYNTTDDIDKLVKALSSNNILEESIM